MGLRSNRGAMLQQQPTVAQPTVSLTIDAHRMLSRYPGRSAGQGIDDIDGGRRTFGVCRHGRQSTSDWRFTRYFAWGGTRTALRSGPTASSL